MRNATRIDDRDVIINQGGTPRHFGTPWRLLGSLAGCVLVLALVVILVVQIRATFDPLERVAREQAVYAQQDQAERLQWADDLAGVAWRLLPVALLAGAGTVGLMIAYKRYAAREMIQAHYAVKAIAHSIKYLYQHTTHHTLRAAIIEPITCQHPWCKMHPRCPYQMMTCLHLPSC